MVLFTLLMEFVVLHTLIDKMYRGEPKYVITREDEEILPVYFTTNEYRPLSMERLFMIDQMIK